MDKIENKHRLDYKYRLKLDMGTLCLMRIDLDGVCKYIRFYKDFKTLFLEDKTSLYRVSLTVKNSIDYIQLLTVDSFNSDKIQLIFTKEMYVLGDFDAYLLIDCKEILEAKFTMFVKTYLKHF